MNPISLLNSEIYRPVVTTLIPGFVAITPFFFLIIKSSSMLTKLMNDNIGLTTGVFILIAITVGLLLEDIGSEIEVRWDACIQKDDSSIKVNDDWYKYLRTTFDIEPIGQRYLRTMTMRMKFELAMVPALLFAIIGITWIEWVYHSFGGVALHIIWLVCLILVSWLLYQSYHSSKILIKLRSELLKGVIRQPPAPVPAPES
jgi:hypothetical protein